MGYVREKWGRVSFTLWPGKGMGVTRGEVLEVLEQLWFATSEFGAASVHGRLVLRGKEAGEVGLLLGNG